MEGLDLFRPAKKRTSKAEAELYLRQQSYLNARRYRNSTGTPHAFPQEKKRGKTRMISREGGVTRHRMLTRPKAAADALCGRHGEKF
jgi:hypothetical protein